MDPVAITAWGCLSSAGVGSEALVAALREGQSRLAPIRLFPLSFATVVGEACAPLPDIRLELSAYACRNARLALKALEEIRPKVEEALARYGAERLGLVLGTSTSGIYDSEQAYVHFLAHGVMPADFNFLRRHAVSATAQFLGLELGIRGPVYAVSTACSSSAKALGAGGRLIQTGVCDAVLVAGVDSLCRLTLYGFQSLGLIAPDPCRPMDHNRAGINIGEAAALLLLERSTAGNRSCPHLLAVGESSDAHHMAAPDPDGRGAESAMRSALEIAGLPPEAVGYVNLHATATSLNDLAEAQAMARLFGDRVPCSGVKGLLGHTLGASGALETIVTIEALRAGWLPGTCGLQRPDPAFRIRLLKDPEAADAAFALCNAFGFGGSNASVLLARSGEDLPRRTMATGGKRPPACRKSETTIALAGWAACAVEPAALTSLGITADLPDPARLPSAIRRRTSQATRLALSAGLLACERAGVDPSRLPAVFASVGGEMQVTDQLCLELAKPDGVISPTQFHNSVHNTAAGYWSIATGCRLATTSLGAAEASVAIAWLEAWCRLFTETEALLLVCYEERWPPYLEPGMGQYPVALAWVLARDGSFRLSAPQLAARSASVNDEAALQAKNNPVLAGIWLIQTLAGAEQTLIRRRVPLGAGWSLSIRREKP